MNPTPSPLLQLPPMQTYDEALAVSKQADDDFFLWAFMLNGWVRDLMAETLLIYQTTDSRPCDFLQNGFASDGFWDLFGKLTDAQFRFPLDTLFRYIKYDNRYTATLRRALVPLAIEEQLTGRPLTPQPGQSPRLLRRTASFWCDWLEATIHLEVHRAVRGNKYTGSDDDSEAAYGFPMCKHTSIQKPFAPGPSCPPPPKPAPATAKSVPALLDSLDCPPFPGEEIETLLIALQPLAKRYEWTSLDWFDVLCDLARHPEPNLTWAQADLENYRRDELGLPPLKSCDFQLPGPPAGLALARKLCPPTGSSSSSNPPSAQ